MDDCMTKYQAINKMQKFLELIYKDFRNLEISNNSAKQLAEDGILSAIGAMEMLKMDEE
mgnify:CR=1 FL=1|jgi:hypothetical protein